MKTKKATAGTVATSSKLRFEPYQKGKHLSSLKLEIGEFLLLGDKQQIHFWKQFDSRLKRYITLKQIGGPYE